MLHRLLDVFASLNAHRIKYLVIGGVAAIAYGVPRPTFDLDMLVEAESENARRLLDALAEIRFGMLISPEDLLAHEITIFRDRVRIDVQTATPGLVFQEAWQRRVEMTYKVQLFYVVSLQDLIASKRASGRNIDLEDVRLLEPQA